MNDADAATVRRVAWRLMPLLTLLYFISILDRSNISVAALTMNHDLGLSAAEYGFAAGIMAIPYMLFEVPSNLALEKFGPRPWIARIMITWGIVAAGQALVWNASSLYWARALLGAAEAGFVPGVLLYMTRWFPAAYRGRMIAIFFLGIPVSLVIGTPMSGLILGMDGLFGVRGWQWVFIIEGIPAVLFGILLPVLMPNDLRSATFLSTTERDRLAAKLDAEHAMRQHETRQGLLGALIDIRVLLLCLAYYGIAPLNNGVVTFLPLTLKAYGVSNTAATFLAAIPYAFGAIGMVVLGRLADRPGKRALANYLALTISVVGLLAAAYIDTPGLRFAAICVAGVGVFSCMPVFWGLPTGILSGSAAAAGIALVNCLAQFGSFVNPVVIGRIVDATGSVNGGLLFLAGMAVMAMVVLTIIFAIWGRPEAEIPRGAALSGSD
ncbi:MAG: MFS transporter [Acidisphaera sp.]|nr:MFS transporter [Acidisphaera sp.]